MADVSQVLLVSRAPKLLSILEESVSAIGHAVAEIRPATEVAAWLRQYPAGLVVVDLDVKNGWGPDVGALLKAVKFQPAVKLLGLVRGSDVVHMRRLFAIHRIRNFLGVSDDDRVDSIDLTVTMSKLLGRELFGPQLYLGANPVEWTTQVHKSDQRQAVSSAAERFASRAGCHASVAGVAATVIDELISNALYNAPRDAAGNPRFLRLPRATPVVLSPDEATTVRLAHDNRRLCISASDPFGTMTAERVIDCLARCFAMGKDQVNFGEGGAGLGLYFIFNLVHQFVINIGPNRRTEAFGIIDVSRSYREYNLRRRSLNIFVEGES